MTEMTEENCLRELAATAAPELLKAGEPRLAKKVD
jgi:hypothetical protein